MDKLVNAAVGRSMAVIGVINSTPAWAAAPDTQPVVGKPTSPAAYDDFAGKVATRYKGKIL